MPYDKKIDILLATYNGERFLGRQIDSILEQMDDRCRLLVRDDSSTDGTQALLRQMAEQHPDRIVLLDESGRLGACGSFGRLIECSDADYLLFCDQDDVWLPGHIFRPIERIQAVEREFGRETPVLAHTDLVVADCDLHTICNSFWAYGKLDPTGGCRLNRLLIQNVVTGCAMTINRPLARLACPIPASAAMHDWWLALVASVFGRVETIGEATTLYRQHSENCVGANRYDWQYIRRKFKDVLSGEAVARWRRTTKRQAEEFQRLFGERLSPQQRETLAAYVGLEDVGFFRRRVQIFRHGFFKTGLMRNIGLLAMI